MNFALAIVIYFIAFLILLYYFSKTGMGLFSALTLTSLLAGILLLFLIPPSEIDHQINLYMSDKKHKKTDDWVVIIYLVVMTLTLLLVTTYVIGKSFEDRERRLKLYGDDYLCDFNHYMKFW
jgi:O-antigen/teichoic acid export membrane protein